MAAQSCCSKMASLASAIACSSFSSCRKAASSSGSSSGTERTISSFTDIRIERGFCFLALRMYHVFMYNTYVIDICTCVAVQLEMDVNMYMSGHVVSLYSRKHNDLFMVM